MSFGEWEMHDGQIVTYPVVGWSSAVIGGKAAIVRLEYVTSEAQLLAGKPDAVQLALTENQALEMIQMLERLVGKIREADKAVKQ